MRSLVRLIVLCSIGLLPDTAAAAEVTFTIDRTQTSITGGGYVGSPSYPIVEQGPGSLVTTCIGELKVDVDESSIQFLNTTLVDAEVNGEWQPGLSGDPGFAPADFAGQANVVLAQIKGSFREILFTLKSNPIATSTSSFDGSQITVEFPSDAPSVFDYNGGWFGADSIPLAGWSTPLQNSVGTITRANGKETITLPLDGAFKFTDPVEGEITIKGKIVATRSLIALPEFDGISRQGDSVTITASNVASTAKLESSIDLQEWDPQEAVRSDNGASTQFTFQSIDPTEFYRLVVP